MTLRSVRIKVNRKPLGLRLLNNPFWVTKR